MRLITLGPAERRPPCDVARLAQDNHRGAEWRPVVKGLGFVIGLTDATGGTEGPKLILGLERPTASEARNRMEPDGEAGSACEAHHVVHGDSVVTGPRDR